MANLNVLHALLLAASAVAVTQKNRLELDSSLPVKKQAVKKSGFVTNSSTEKHHQTSRWKSKPGKGKDLPQPATEVKGQAKVGDDAKLAKASPVPAKAGPGNAPALKPQANASAKKVAPAPVSATGEKKVTPTTPTPKAQAAATQVSTTPESKTVTSKAEPSQATAERKPEKSVNATALNASSKKVVADLHSMEVANVSDSTLNETLATAPRCSSPLSNGHVHYFVDSEGEQRCFVIVMPIGVLKPVPLFFWFHQSGGNAEDCGSLEDDETSLVSVAQKNGVGLVCTEAAQGTLGVGGQWAIPSQQTTETGTKCDASDSVDIDYMHGMFRELRESYASRIDIRAIFLAGISMGGAFSEYMSVCMNKELGDEHVFSFASHSTGIKVKGDGLTFPQDIQSKEHAWAECPDCGFFPFVPEKTNGTLKACLFDNTDDPTAEDPFFYTSTMNLKKQWEELGNRAEVHPGTGGHMRIHSFRSIMGCLDDGTGKLLTQESASYRVRTSSTLVLTLAFAVFIGLY